MIAAVSVAGLKFMFRVHDGECCRRMSFGCGGNGMSLLPEKTRPAGRGRRAGRVVDVYVKSGRFLRPVHEAAAEFRIQGAGQYAGWWNEKQKRGALYISKRASADNALMGFLRQAAFRSLAASGGFMLHASCVEGESGAYIFGGRSGAGKSTVCALSGEHGKIISEDMIAARPSRGQWRVWAWPPVPGDKGGPVRAVFRLVKDTRHALRRAPLARVVADTLVAPPAGASPALVNKTLAACEKFMRAAPVYDLHFARNPGFWRCISASLPGSRHKKQENFVPLTARSPSSYGRGRGVRVEAHR